MDLHAGRPLSAPEISERLAEARARTLLLVASLSDDDLRRQHDPLMSPIVWDLGHIAHFEEVWLVENLESGATGSEGLRGMYDPFQNPRSLRDSLALPGLAECLGYMARIRRSVLDHLERNGMNTETPLLRDGFVYRMVLQHEYQHNETICQTLQLKQGAPFAAPRQLVPPDPAPEAWEPGTMVRFPDCEIVTGTDDRSVAYDNERPAHRVELDAFWIDVHPVTNEEYARFLDDGAYERRDAWTRAGWAWRKDSGARAPKYWSENGSERTERFMDVVVPLEADRPVSHICYWEADAFARWAGKRLPTEVEWEAAASWDPVTGRKHMFPWGESPPTPRDANLDALIFATTRVGSYPGGVSPIGCWDMLGNVWEWTSTDFHGYPGYETFPYREYSEAFFGSEYKVLRGGSWATRLGAIRNTFRNWDYPIRRQIFSGVRCAKDG